MARPIPKTYTLEMYMKKMKDQDIRSDAYVQRMAGQWSYEMINELVYTVLNDSSDLDDGYIPPIILGEDFNSQLWIIDGLQRSTSLMMFRYGNYKITSSMDNTFITYKEKIRDEKGNIMKDECGNIIWKDVDFNLKGKTYEMLPDELKKVFNEYQIDTVTHRNCTMERMSKLIKKYNNHASMNPAQRAFTCVEKYARNVRDILNEKFFDYCYDDKDRTKGKLERIVLESVMVANHLDDWKSGAKQLAKYLNDNSSQEEFEALHNNIISLEGIITEDVRDIFTIKDSFIWLALFDKFKKYENDDKKFIGFLKNFKESLHSKEVNGMVFDTIDKDKGTKDKIVIKEKLELLETLMCEYLHINIEETHTGNVEIIDFVCENVDKNVSSEDIELYTDILDDLTLSVDNNTRLLDDRNRPSLVAIVAYGCMNDIDLDDWFVSFFESNNNYMVIQSQNFTYMKKDLEKYLVESEVKSA